jgi:glutamyl-tRNA synthetase
MTVVTRFAPSPTGFLHIGSARTALFNWLFARHHGGNYLLRIEDTDRARSTMEAVEAILDGLDWLGLKADGQTLYQFARAGRHAEIARAMVESGRAFRCYVTPEELEARRQRGAEARQRLAAVRAEGASTGDLAAAQAQAAELTRAFRSPYRDGLKPPSPSAPYVVRLRAPDEGEIVNDDLVQGVVRTPARDVDDLVLLRSDGTPTYMLSVVVDDYDMGVTHVIRGDDHLTNTARQIPIFQAMDWPTPLYGHLPLIHGPDGAKLSKRHGAQTVQEFRDMGYLPEALLNYLARLGWSHGDDEIFSLEQAVQWFDIKDVNRGPSRLDFNKLASVNAHYLRSADDDRLARLLVEFIALHKGWTLEEPVKARLRAALPALKPRAKTMVDLADQSYFLIAARPLRLDASAEKAMKDAVVLQLRRLKTRLEGTPRWDEPSIAAELQGFAKDEGVGMGQIGPGLRAALTGGAPSPDLAQTLAFLGREEALARLADRL